MFKTMEVDNDAIQMGLIALESVHEPTHNHSIRTTSVN